MTFSYQAPVPLFHVFDVTTSIGFYRDVLGFELVTTSEADSDEAPGWALLRVGDITLMLNEAHASADRPAFPDSLRTAMHADTVLYMVCMELEALCTHLRRSGIRANRLSASFRGMEQVFVSDPDGYMLCFEKPLIALATRH